MYGQAEVCCILPRHQSEKCSLWSRLIHVQQTRIRNHSWCKKKECAWVTKMKNQKYIFFPLTCSGILYFWIIFMWVDLGRDWAESCYWLPNLWCYRTRNLIAERLANKSNSFSLLAQFFSTLTKQRGPCQSVLLERKPVFCNQMCDIKHSIICIQYIRVQQHFLKTE